MKQSPSNHRPVEPVSARMISSVPPKLEMPNRLARAVALALLASACRGDAAAFSWNLGDGSWSDGAQWVGTLAPPSAATTDLIFGGSGATPYTSTNDFGAPFLLNSIVLQSAATAAETITGGTIEFTNDGAELPAIVEQGSGAFTIFAEITADAPLMLGGFGTGVVRIDGPIASATGITVSGGTYQFTSTGSTFSGGTTILGGGTLELLASAPNSGLSVFVQGATVLGGNSAANPLAINGGTLKLTTRGSGGLTLDGARVVSFGANGGVLDLRNINEADAAVQGGHMLNGELALTTTAGAATAVIRWSGGQFGLSNNKLDDGNWRASQNALRLAAASGTGPVRFELTNGALLNVDFNASTPMVNFSMPVTYRGVAGGDPTSGPAGTLNSAVTRAVGRVLITNGNVVCAGGVTFEDAVQMSVANASRAIDSDVRIAGTAGGHSGYALFSGRSSSTALAPAINEPGNGAAGQNVLFLGRDFNDTLTVESGGTAALDLRFRFDQPSHNGVVLNARTALAAGATLRITQSLSNFSPTTGSAVNTLNANVGNHLVQGRLIGQGNTLADSVIDLLLPAGNVIPASPAAGSLPLGGVNFDPTADLVVNGSGFGGLRIDARARPSVLFSGGAADPVSTAAKLDNLLTATRLAALTGSGGFLTPAAQGATWNFPSGGEWSAAVPVGLRVVDSMPGGIDVRLGALASFNHNLAVEAGATLDTGASLLAFGDGVRGRAAISGTGAITGAGGVLVQSGARVSPGLGGVGTLTVSTLTLNGALEIETTNSPANDVLAVQGNLTLGGALRLPATNQYGAASYTIATYSGTRTGTFAAFENLPADYALDYGSGTNDAIRLVSDPKATRVWNGDVSGVWDLSSANWQGGATFADDLNARFDDTATGTHNVTFGSGSVLPRSVTFDTAGNYSLTATGTTIAGRAQLVKNGAGTLTLSGPAAYAGGTVVNAGTLKLGADSSLPGVSSVFVAGGATLDMNGRSATIGDLRVDGNVTAGALTTGAVTLGAGANLAANLTLGGGVSKTGATGATMSGTVDLGGTTQQFDIAAGTAPELTISGALSNGGLVKTGPGTLLLTGANTFTGLIAIRNGTLRLGAPGTLASTTNVTVGFGATFDLANMNQTVGALSGGGSVTLGSAALNIAQAGSAEFSGTISGTGPVLKTGAGFLDLTGTNTFSGGLTVSGGQLRLGNGLAAGSGPITAAPGGTLIGGVTLPYPITLAGGTLAGVNTAALDLTSGDVTVTAASSIAMFNVRTPATNVNMQFSGVLHGGGALTLVSGPGNSTPSSGPVARFINVTTPSDYSGTLTVGQSTQLDVRSPGGNFSSIGTGRIVVAGGTITGLSGQAVLGTYSTVRVRTSAEAVLGNNVEFSGTGSANFNLGAIGGAAPSMQTFGNLRIGNAQELTVNRGTAGFTLAFQSVTLTGGTATFSPGDPSFGGVAGTLQLGPIGESAAGSGFIMGGLGTLRLAAGTSTISGPTKIENGVLSILGTLAGTSDVTVQNGTLGGTGAIGKPVTVGDDVGGAGTALISAGLSGSVGTLATGALGLAHSDAGWQLELASSSAVADLINVNGTLSLGTGVAALITADLSPALILTPTSFTVAHATGGVSGFFAGLPEGAPLAVGPNIFTITYAANGGNDIVLTAPEPSVALSILAGTAGLAGLRRRRTREP